MKKFVLILLALIAFAKLTNAQVSTIFGYDKEIVLPAMNEYVRLIGADSDGFYALRIDEKDALHLDFYNNTSMSRENSNQLILPMLGGMQSEYVEMFYLDSKLILFFQVVDNTRKEKTLYIQHVNRTGRVIGEATAIGKLTNQNMSVDFHVELMDNQQNIFVYYHRPFQTYNEEPFFFKVYDPDMREIYNNIVKLPLVNQDFEIEQIKIANSGNVYMLARVSPDPRQLKRMKTIIYDYKLLYFNVSAGTVKDVDIKGKKHVLVDAIIGVDEEENIDIFGFMVRKGKTDYEGIFHQKYNPTTETFVTGDSKKADYVFSKTEVPEFRAPHLAKNYSELYNYKLIDVLHLSNGGSAVIAEHQNHWVDSIVVPGTKEILYNDYYRFNDVLVAYCSPENNMEWMTRIPKTQYSYNDLGQFSSIASFAIGEKIFVFYNDNAKNVKLLQNSQLTGNDLKEIASPSRRGVAVAVSIFSDGKMHGDYLFTKKNKKFRIMPEFFKEFNGRHYIYTQSGTKVKFGMFVGR